MARRRGSKLGPWRVKHAKVYMDDNGKLQLKRPYVAKAEGPEKVRFNTEAKAALVASSPELLSLLSRAVEDVEFYLLMLKSATHVVSKPAWLEGAYRVLGRLRFSGVNTDPWKEAR
jgi:hypothetical protein